MSTRTMSDAVYRSDLTGLAARGAVAATAAVAVNAVVRTVAVAGLGVPARYAPLGWSMLVGATVVGVLGATAVHGLIARLSVRPDRTFVAVAGLVLLTSFGSFLAPPAFLAGAPASVTATLVVLHLTTAAVAVGTLVGLGRTGAGAP